MLMISLCHSPGFLFESPIHSRRGIFPRFTYLSKFVAKMIDQSSKTTAAALDALLPGPGADHDLSTGELEYYLSPNHPRVRPAFSAMATSGLDGSSSTAEPRWESPNSRRTRHLLLPPGWRDR